LIYSASSELVDLEDELKMKKERMIARNEITNSSNRNAHNTGEGKTRESKNNMNNMSMKEIKRRAARMQQVGNDDEEENVESKVSL
jgi:nicotinamide mononucleotide adenylyltransferase